MKKIKIQEKILNLNDEIALENNKVFSKLGIKTFNLMGSPGAGKTSFIINLSEIVGRKNIAVIEGDLASSIDTKKLKKLGIQAIQINTGGMCHLDAQMIRKVITKLDFKNIKYLFVENVGNLVCPANFRLGTDKSIVLSSVAEGSDKPYKYPGMFLASDLVVLTKSDLIKVFDFDVKYFSKGIKILIKKSKIINSSTKTNEGFEEIAKWVVNLG